MLSAMEPARAKVNLYLRILGRRPDGYHELESLVAFADLADRVTVDGARPAGLSTSGPFAAAIVGENLVARAIAMVVEPAPALARALGHVALEKHIPVAAGLGGGSADAAAVLRLARRLLPPATASSIDWLALATRLGADVPVCLESRAAVMTGIGEAVTPVELPRLPAVLANPMIEVPADKTRRVFKELAAAPLSASHHRPPPGVPASSSELLALASRIGNDLEPAACRVMPALAAVRDAIAACEGCLLAQLSGAGPTCLGVFRTDAEAATAAVAIKRAHADWWVQATALS